MPIPEFVGSPHAYWLPPGVHDCTHVEVESRLVHNAQRRRVWGYLKFLLNRVRDLGGRLDPIVIDGSFVTGRAEPGDVDGCCLVAPDDLERMLDASEDQDLLRFFLLQPHDAKRILGVHMFVIADPTQFDSFCRFFAAGEQPTGLRAPDPDRDPPGLVTPPEKGILRVSFTDFFDGGSA